MSATARRSLFNRCAPWRLAGLAESGAFRKGAALPTFALPSLALPLGPQNAAPLLVLGDRHAALDADSHPGPGGGISGKELFQKGHAS